MNIYKEAQEFLFEDREGLASILGRLRRDAEYREYISLLSAVHGEMKSSGKSLEEAVNIIDDSFGRNNIKKIITAIGIDRFTNGNIISIVRNMDELRRSALGEESGAPAPEAAPKEAPALIPRNKLDYMPPKKVVEYFRGLLDSQAFPPDRMEDASAWIDSLEDIYTKIYVTREITGSKVNSAIKIANDLKARLYALAASLEDEDEVTEEISAPPTRTLVRQEETEKVQLEDEEEDEDEEDIEKQDPRNAQSVDRDQALANSIFDVGDTFMDFSTAPPTINKGALDKAYKNFLSELVGLQREYSQGISISEETGIKINVGKKTIKSGIYKLNMLMAGIKEFSLGLKEAFDEAKNREPELDVLAEYNFVEYELAKQLPARRIFNDESVRQKLYQVTVAYGSPKLSRIVDYQSETDLIQIAEKAKKGAVVQGNVEDIIKEMSTLSITNFNSKLNTYLDLSMNANNSNYISWMSLDSHFIFNKAVKNISGPQIRHEIVHCPTCYKFVKKSTHEKIVKTTPALGGFRVRLFSFYTNDGRRITQEDLTQDPNHPRKERKFHFPIRNSDDPLDLRGFFPVGDPTFENEIKKSLKYTEDKTWKEINELLRSNNRDKHEEGWHRRAAALSSLNAKHIKDVKIKNIMTRCPFGDGRDNSSGCGINYTTSPEQIATLGVYGAQPGWNGVDNTSLDRIREPTELSLDPRGLNEEQIERLKKQQSAGYKFSDVSFACPCYIPKTDMHTNFKHNVLAVPMAGPVGPNSTVFPTDPDGNISEELRNSTGTLGFLVCGAPASLSSFDRDPNSQGFILKYLKEIFLSSHEKYFNLINSLIGDGVDVDMVMALDDHLRETITNEASDNLYSKSYNITSRKKWLTKVLDKIAGVVSMSKREIYSGLSLVCPFGHKFTVKQSLDFGSTHLGIQSKSITRFSSVINMRGDSNIKAMTTRGRNRLLVPVYNYPNHKGLLYKEWLEQPEDKRDIIPTADNLDKFILMFRAVGLSNEPEDYFLAMTKFRQIWSDDKSYKSRSIKEEFVQDPTEASRFSNSSLEMSGEDGETLSAADLYASEQFKLGMYSEEDYNEFVPTSRSIPGSIDLDPDEPETPELYRAHIESKIEALSRSIRCCLRIIHVWTHMVATPTMTMSFFKEYTPNIQQFEGQINKIFESSKELMVFDNQGSRVSYGEEYSTIISELSTHATKVLGDKVDNLFPYLRDRALEFEKYQVEEQVAADILKAALVQAVESFESERGEVDDSGDLASELEKISSSLYKDDHFIKEVTFNSVEFRGVTEERMKYTSQIVLVAYAHFLAGILSRIYNKYFVDKSSPYYIGYDLGIDLSSPDKILGYEGGDGQWIEGVTKSKVDNIVSSLEGIEGLRRPQEGKPQIGQKIDRFYEDLRKGIITAAYHAVTPATMEAAKEYLISKLTLDPKDAPEEAKSNISRILPTRTFNFNGTIEKPETSESALPGSRVPFISRGKGNSIMDFPDRKTEKMWVLIDKMNRYRKDLPQRAVFNTKEEAEARMKELEAEGSGAGESLVGPRFSIIPYQYHVVDSIGYDGSTTQVGVYGERTVEAKSWPPPTLGYVSKGGGFVGLMLPFRVGQTLKGNTPDALRKSISNTSALRQLLITDYQVVVDFYGEPLDISLLFRRGRTEEQAALLLKKEQGIIDRKNSMIERVSKRWAELGRKERTDINMSEILSRAEQSEREMFEDEVFSLLSEIVKMPLAVRVSGTWQGRGTYLPMGVIVLEDPVRCYKIIKDPEIRGAVLSPQKKEALIRFIIEVYNMDALAEMISSKTGKEVTARQLLENPTIAGKKINISTEEWQDTTKFNLAITSFNIDPSRVADIIHDVAGMEKEYAESLLSSVPVKIMENASKSEIERAKEALNRAGVKVNVSPATRPGWVTRPGMYFNVIPSEPGSNQGTHLSYAYHSFPKEQDLIPEGEHATTALIHSRIQLMKGQGILDSNYADSRDLLSKIQETLKNYIHRCTEAVATDEARDHKKLGDSKSYKIFKRMGELERMMFSMGIVDYGDQDMPQY